MAATGLLRSGLSLLAKSLRSDVLSSSSQRSAPQLSRNFAAASGQEKQVKVPVAMFGGTGKYATALYIAAVKSNALEKVEAELVGLVEAMKRSPKFSEFAKDLSVPANARIKAINEISADAKHSDITKNFLAIVAESGRLKHLDSIANRFLELTRAHRGEVEATVTTVIPLPEEEEKELRETLQDIFGKGKKVHLKHKIDPSILGGLVVEFGQKVFDMSIKTRAEQMERFLREPINIGSL